MQKFIIETSPYRIGKHEQEYDFIRRCHSIPTMETLRICDRRILIFRDPVDRIRSLFVNKFVQRHANIGIFNSYRTVTGKDPDRATFREFVLNYVARLDDTALDPHVWPQHWHLCSVVYEYALPLAGLRRSMTHIVGPDIAARFFHRKINPSLDVDVKIDAEIRSLLSVVYAGDFKMIDQIT